MCKVISETLQEIVYLFCFVSVTCFLIYLAFLNVTTQSPNNPITSVIPFPFLIVARLAGFEPATHGLEVRSSIHLSYRRLIANYTTPLNFRQGQF